MPYLPSAARHLLAKVKNHCVPSQKIYKKGTPIIF